MMNEKPLPSMVRAACEIAKRGPCAKSKRGVVLYGRITGAFYSEAHNMPPPDMPGRLGRCDGDEACRASCNKRCLHAESLAIRNTSTTWRHPFGGRLQQSLILVHVKVDNAGELVAGGGPSCWQCSREVVDCGFIHGVWLYQTAESRGVRYPDGDDWAFYEAFDFHRLTAAACGID